MTKKKSIFSRIGSVFLALACAVTCVTACIDESMLVADAASTDDSMLATSEEIAAKAARLFGTGYTFGAKGGNPYATPYTIKSVSEVKAQGIDCAGLVYWTLAQLGYKTSGFVQNNPVPSDTYLWEMTGSKAYITRNSKTVQVVQEKNNLPTPSNTKYSTTYEWWKKKDGSVIAPGSVVIATETDDGIDHAWIYLGKFNSVSEVRTYLKNAVKTYESSSYDSLLSYINSNTYVYDNGSGSKYWRIEATGGQGVVVNNGSDGKNTKALSISSFVVAKRTASFSIEKTDKQTGDVIGKSKVDGSSAIYGIYTDKACKTKVGSITIGSNGSGTTTISYDSSLTYYAKETKAPTGWDLDSTVYIITPNSKLKVSDDESTGSIKINKKAETGLSVANRTFRLTYTENGSAQKIDLKTNSSGVVTFDGLHIYDVNGTGKAIKYTVTEILTTKEKETIIQPAAQNVYLTNYKNQDYTANLTFTNKWNTGNLKVNKVFYDANGKVLAADDLSNEDYSQVTFQLFRADGAPIGVTGSAGSYTYSSTGSGAASNLKLKSKTNLTLTVDNLPTGEYVIKETSCSVNYTADADGEVVIKKGNTATVKMSNSHVPVGSKYARISKDWKLYTDTFGNGDTLTTDELNILNSQIFFLVAIKYDDNGTTRTRYLADAIYEGTKSSDGSVYSIFDANCMDSGTGALITDNLVNSYKDASFFPISYARSGIQIENLPESTIEVVVKEQYINTGLGTFTPEQIITRIDECVKTADHKLSDGKYLSENYRAGSGTMRENNADTDKVKNYISHFVADGNGDVDDPDNYIFATFASGKKAASGKMINRERHVQLGFSKKSTSGESLSGGLFMLYVKDGDNYVALLDEGIPASDEEEYTYFEGAYAPNAEYYVKEIEAPDGFILDADTYWPINVCIKSDDNNTSHTTTQLAELPLESVYISEIENSPIPGKIEIYKTDSTYNVPLEGITFNIVDGDNAVVDTITTNEDGYAVSKEIALGDYKIIEVTEAAPYVINHDPIPVSIASADIIATAQMAVVTVNVQNEQEEGILSIHKSGYNDVALAGAVFEIRYKDTFTDLGGTKHNAGDVVCEITTNADGIATTSGTPLYTGVNYTCVETQAPDGYITPSSSTDFSFDWDGNEFANKSIEISNAPKQGTLKVQKRTEGDLNVEGIRFILSGTSDIGTEVRMTAVTDADGIATFTGVLIGTYTITEDGDTVPYAYLVSDEQTVTVIYAQTSNVEFYNQEKEGTITVQKRTEGDLNREGIDFVLSGTSDSGRDVEITATTDADGVAKFENIPIGTYTVTEDGDSVPYAYLTAAPQEVEVFYAQTSNVEFYNQEKEGTITVQKRTEGDLNREGIDFVLSGTSDSGRDVEITATTDADGVAKFENIPIGTYTVTEDAETTPYAYLTADPQTVEVFYAQTTDATIYNEEKSGTIKVQKRTEGDLNLEGIKFILSGTSDSGREIEIEATTNADGEATFENIPIGTYTVTEGAETTPYAYLTADPQTVEVFYAKTTDTTFFNEEKQGSIKVQKRTEGMTDLEGISFTLTGSSDSGREIKIAAVTDAEGVANFENVPIGSYTIFEDGETVPFGYFVADPQTVEVFYAESVDVEFINDTTKVDFSKKSITGDDELEGAKLQVKDKDGNVIDEWTSGKEAHLIVGKLKANETYILHEEIAPDGYVVANDIEFTVDEKGKVQHVEMVDDITKIEVSKVAVTGGDELPGATLQVIDKDGNIVEEWVSTNEVHKIYGKLKANETYTLRETIAPDGYEIATDIQFTVNGDGSVQHVEMVDKIKETPHNNETPQRGNTSNTGSERNAAPFILIVDTLTLGTIAILIIRRRKSHKQ